MAETDVSNVNARTVTLSKAPSFAPYSKVVLYVGVDENGNSINYTAGDDTGRTLHVSNEWGSQTMANNILAQIYGFQYQPYKATGALADPATELGDGVNIGGLYSGVYEYNLIFNTLMAGELAAPVDEEVEHEYGFESTTNRAYTRMVAQTKAGISLNAREITAQVSALRYDTLDPDNSESLASRISLTEETIEQEVSDRKSADDELSSLITQTAKEIRATVVEKTGGNTQSFAWDLQSTYFKLTANNKDIFTADSNGISVTGRGSFSGEITATSGTVGGITIAKNSIYTNGKVEFDTAKAGLHISSSGIALGNGTFSVDSNGNLTATRATLTGKITATSGYIGNGSSGFTISNTAIYNGMTSISDTSHNGVYIGANGIALGKGAFVVDSSGNVTMKNLTANNAVLKGTLTIYSNDGTSYNKLGSGDLYTGAYQSANNYGSWNNAYTSACTSGGYSYDGAGYGYFSNRAFNEDVQVKYINTLYLKVGVGANFPTVSTDDLYLGYGGSRFHASWQSVNTSMNYTHVYKVADTGGTEHWTGVLGTPPVNFSPSWVVGLQA